VDGDPGELDCRDLALARMKAASEFEPKRPHGVPNRTSAPDRARGTIEAH
jgi:hypothetical protein